MEQKEKTFPRKEAVFADYCRDWLTANSAHLKLSSCAKYRSDITNHIIPFLGDCVPCEITSKKVDSFTQTLLDQKNLSAKTARDILALFHSIFTYMKKRTEQNVQDPEIIYPHRHKTEVRVLNKREEEQLSLYLVQEMDRYKFGVYMALRTGLRVGELCALRWSDISLNSRTISVRHTVQRIRCEPGAEHAKTRVIIGTPKSDSSCRLIPLMPDLVILCNRFYQGNPDHFILTGTPKCPEPRTLQRRLKTYTSECRLEEVHFHTLRHTFATRCMEVGFDMKILSEILGHSSISITMNQYVHPNLEQKRENMSRLKAMVSF